MKAVTFAITKEKINHYLQNDIFTPFFIVIDESQQYDEFLKEYSTIAQIRTSSFCANNDSFPDIDAICNHLHTISKPTLLLGFGEAVSFSGKEESLDRLKDLLLSSKVLVLCRSIRGVVKNIASNDKKFGSSEKKRVVFLKPGTPYKVVKYSNNLDVPAIDGFKELLVQIENGVADNLKVSTSLILKNTEQVNTYYDVIKYLNPSFNILSTVLDESLWEEYYNDNELEGYKLDHWRTFLKYKIEMPKDAYLKYVIEKSCDYNTYKKQLYCALLDVNINDKHFITLYNARKTILKDFKDLDIADYIAETLIKDKQRIYYLTDNTLVECQAIIQALDGIDKIPDEIRQIYPALYDYMQSYSFNCEKGKLFTDYFNEYKYLKLTNQLTFEFHNKVKTLAVDGQRPYNSLKTRGEILDSIDNNNSILFWVDALGVEYLGFIQNRVKALGLKLTIHTVRANLPTITSENKDFYETWTDDKKYKNKELDELKHSGEKDYNYQTTKIPIHLVAELKIIDEVLEWCASKLRGKTTEKIILVSDHGASRLAVINEQECIWELSEKGAHCGRCCPCNDVDVKPDFTTNENGFWVLANYDRFKGSRKASVEVHGGATLEEVVIPLIEIELVDSKIEIDNLTPETTASFKKNAEIILFSKNKLKKVSIRVIGKQYYSEKIADNKYKIILPDIKKAGSYTADVLEGDNLIGEIIFNVVRESGKSNDTDWF